MLEHVQAGCRSVRDWLSEHFDLDSAQCIRILCGGSVSPACALGLLSLPGVDGLGAGRKGRSPDTFAGIVRLTAQAHARSG